MSEQRFARWVWWCAPPLLAVVVLLFALASWWPPSWSTGGLASPVPLRTAHYSANVQVAGPVPAPFAGQETLYQRVRSAVVYAAVEAPAEAGSSMMGGATGVVWDSTGHVIVPAQLVREAQRVEIVLPGGTARTGTVVGADVATNVAVVRLEQMPVAVAPLPLAGRQEIEVDRLVHVMWNTLDGSVVLKTGRVVETGRLLPVGAMRTAVGVSYFAIPDVLKVEVAEPVTGTQSAIVVDAKGRLEGFVLPLFHEEMAVYAVPAYLMARVAEGLIREGKYRYPWIGLSGQTVTPELAEALGLPVTSGVLVLAVLPGAPAEKAGLRGGSVLVRVGDRLTYTGGDIITRIDGEPVATVNDLIRHLIYRTRVGQRVKLDIVRDGRSMSVELEVGARPEAPIFD